MALVIVVTLQESNGKHKVRSLLVERGFDQIKVITKMFNAWGSALTFEVNYIDRNGVLQRNSCVVHTSIFSVEKVLWEEPID